MTSSQPHQPQRACCDQGGRRPWLRGEEKPRDATGPSVPVLVTAAHCLPFFPPCRSASYQGEHTYKSLLGRIGEATAIWAECLFADPVADIAVLGPPDTQVLPHRADAYEELMATTLTLPRSDATHRRLRLVAVARSPLVSMSVALLERLHPSGPGEQAQKRVKKDTFQYRVESVA